MDELVKVVSERAGIPEEQARMAAQAVIDFLKQKLPAPIASQIDAALAGSSLPGDLSKGLGGMFGR
jgi:hypothetical protein